MLDNLNLQPVADVANNLINKLSDAVGWVANRETLNKKAIETYIAGIESNDDPPLIKAAKISQAKKTIKEYLNQCNILEIAKAEITNPNSIKDVDNDWIAQFFDMARLISSDEFQVIWGKMLAEECNEPGAIPKSTLFILQKMDKKDATDFMNLSKFVINVCGDYATCITPNIFNESSSERALYVSCGVDLDSLTRMESLGLVKIALNTKGEIFSLSIGKKSKKEINYHNFSVEVKNDVKRVPIGVVILTKDGEALFKAIQTEKIEDFWRKIVLPFMETAKVIQK